MNSSTEMATVPAIKSSIIAIRRIDMAIVYPTGGPFSRRDFRRRMVQSTPSLAAIDKYQANALCHQCRQPEQVADGEAETHGDYCLSVSISALTSAIFASIINAFPDSYSGPANSPSQSSN